MTTSVTVPAPGKSGAKAEPRREIGAGARVGHYEIVRELGRGGMGAVFLARDTKLGRRVAIKFLLERDPELNKRFTLEARATARCTHENIVVIHEVGEHDGNPFMVLEHLEGEPLSAMIRGKTFPAARAIELVAPVVAALVRAHDDGIVHRDLKPANIFVTAAGTIKVLDFGIAKVFDEPRESRATNTMVAVDGEITMAGQVVGTLPFMAPEQWTGDSADHRVDLYAVGVILYRMVTGDHPVNPPTAEALEEAARRLDTPHPSVADGVTGLPTRFVKLVDRCLAKHKDDRYASASELARDLDALRPRVARHLHDDDTCPYPGLTSFAETDAHRFFGRTRDVARGAARVRDLPITAVVGPSGAGKSSFIHAGLVPALRSSGEAWEVIALRPGRAPLASLVAATVALANTAIDEARLRSEAGTLGSVLRTRAARDGTRFLIVVDQYEEAWTLVDDPEERAAFNACIAAAADDVASPVRVAVCVRSDFLDRIAEDRHLGDQIVKNLFFLGAPGRDALHDALVLPAEQAGYRFETDDMVKDMLDGLEITTAALPLLQFGAASLWEHRDRTRKLLTSAAYAAMGGTAGALANHAERVFAELTPAEQRLVRAMLLRLVTPEGTRATTQRDELCALGDRASITALIDRLVLARLLVVHSHDDGAMVELVHDSLTTAWPRLRRWREESHEDAALVAELRVVAKQWDARGRAPGSLWRGDALDEARRFQARYRGELAERERAFLAAAFSLETRTARRRRILIGTFVTMLAAGAIAATIAMFAIRRAEREARDQAGVARVEAARARAAEAETRHQLELVRAAEHRQHEAETTAARVGEEVQMTQAELEAANRKQQAALAEIERQRGRASKSAATAQRATAKVESMTEEEKKRRDDAEQAKKAKESEIVPVLK